MAYDIQWIDEGKLIHFKMYGDTPEAEFFEMNEAMLALIGENPLQVHYLVDLSETKMQQIRVFAIARAFTFLNHPLTGFSAFYGTDNPLFRNTANMIGFLTKRPLKWFDTYDTALAFLRTLDHLPASELRQPEGH
jgi:hypothetical protein